MTNKTKATACWLGSSLLLGAVAGVVAVALGVTAAISGGVVTFCMATTRSFWLRQFGI